VADRSEGARGDRPVSEIGIAVIWVVNGSLDELLDVMAISIFAVNVVFKIWSPSICDRTL
jgi:hypothetical protein